MEITFLGIFLEGILSFLSPCVLPLVPLYMSYLVGDNKQVDENGDIKYKTFKVFLTTLFFVLGISLTFVILAISIDYIKDFFIDYSEIISLIGGTILIIFALHETGLIHIDILDKQLKPKINIHLEKMNYLKAFIFGFIFSVGWSPCIGPMLSNAIFMASTNANGYLYIVLYGLGLVIPFLITGLLTSKVLNFIEKKKKLFKTVLIVAGIIMICFGGYLIYDASNKIVSLKNNDSQDVDDYLINYDFVDQNNEKVNLVDYKGKYVFLNFTTTWCTYCEIERPYYEEFSNNDDVVCLYVMSDIEETSTDAIYKHIKDNNIQLKTIIDNDGILFYYCNIQSYPTTFVLSPNGDFLTYYSGALDLNGFNDLLAYAKDLYNNK